MLVPDPIARRVARRHNAAVLFRNVPTKNARVEYSNTGRISAVELMRMLEPQLGALAKLRFRPAITGTPNTIGGEAITESANIVSGKLVLHAAVADDEVISWADFVVEEDRDARAAVRVAVRCMRDSVGLVRVDDEEGDELVGDEAILATTRTVRSPSRPLRTSGHSAILARCTRSD
jgi:hypothetical protein